MRPGEPEEILLQGITHRTVRGYLYQRLTACGIYCGDHGTPETKESGLAESRVDCMACIAARVTT